MYAKYGFWASIVLEVLLCIGHYAKASVAYKMRINKPSPTLPDEADEEQESEQKPAAQVAKVPHQTEEEENHQWAKQSIFRLQRQFADCTDRNDDAKTDAAQKGLMNYKSMGYNINTGEFMGIVDFAQNEGSRGGNMGVTTLLSPIITPEQRVIVIKNSAHLQKYPDVLEAVEAGLSITETAKHCGVSESIVKLVRRDAIFYQLIAPYNPNE